MDKHRKSITSLVDSVNQAIQPMNNSMTNLTDSVYQAMQPMYNNIARLADSVNQDMQPMYNKLADFANQDILLFNKNIATEMNSLYSSYKNFIKTMENTQINLAEAISKSLINTAHPFKYITKENISNYTEEIIYDFLQETEDLADLNESFEKIKNDITKNPKSNLSNILYSTLLFILSISFDVYLYKKADEKSNINFKETKESIFISRQQTVEELTKIIKEELNSSQIDYIVTKKTGLYEKPSMKSHRIKYIYNNQPLRLVERKRQWVFVEYFNNITKYHEKGWCLKKYLKKFK